MYVCIWAALFWGTEKVKGLHSYIVSGHTCWYTRVHAYVYAFANYDIRSKGISWQRMEISNHLLFHQQWLSNRIMAMALRQSSNIRDRLQHRMQPVQRLEGTLWVEGRSRTRLLDRAPPPSSLRLGRVATMEERFDWILWMEQWVAAL